MSKNILIISVSYNFVHEDGEASFEDFDRRSDTLHPGQQPFADGRVVAFVDVDSGSEGDVLDDARCALQVFRRLFDAVAERGHAVLRRLVLVHRGGDEHDVIVGLVFYGGATGDIQDVVDVAVAGFVEEYRATLKPAPSRISCQLPG